MTEEDGKPSSMPGATGVPPAAESASTRMNSPPTSNTSAAPAASGGVGIAWLALLLVLALAALGVWALLEAQQRESELRQHLQAVEAGAGRDLSAIDQINRNLERQVELEVAAARTTLRGEWQDQVEQLRERARAIAGEAEAAKRQQQDSGQRLESLQDELAALRKTLDDSLEAFDSQLARQRARLEQFSADDRDSWLLAEAYYLLRLANQRLITTGDTEAAEALMRSADGILREIGDAGLHEVRTALASDLAAVRAVPALDLEAAYLRLGALVDQAAELIMFELPGRSEERVVPVEAEGGWGKRLRRGYEKALDKLSEYVVFRRRDVPVESLMDPQWEGMLRQNLRLLLEQAQVALLSGNQRLFRESLERTRGWIVQFPISDEQAARAMLRELEDLASMRVSVDIPDASRTLQAMQSAMSARAGDGSGDQ